MKIVADTNVLISGFLWNGLPARFVDAGLTGRFAFYTSGALLDELAATLSAHRFAARLASCGYTASGLVAKFRQSCHEVAPAFSAVSDDLRDRDDLHVLSCAANVPVDLIVSGDKDLLVLGAFQDIPVVDVRRALEVLG